VKIVAPGKLLLTGAYAVLEGAPALVVAVDRHAVADVGPGVPRVAPSDSPREVRAAFGAEETPALDVRALYHRDAHGDAKLGLGSSAAALVAALGAREALRGEDVQTAPVRGRIFALARRAHAEAQGGGSGVDIAASVHGGVLVYACSGSRQEVIPTSTRAALPHGLELRVVWSGTSARTSELRARVDALRARDAKTHARCIAALGDASAHAVAATGDLAAFLEAVRATEAALAALGEAADAPIVPPAFAQVAAAAARDGAVFLPSGAGGGDVGVFLGARAPTESFLSRVHASGMHLLAIGLDRSGVRPLGKVDQD
jgi:phosphomevalonate kinase